MVQYKVSIIIPVKEINDYIRQAMKYYANLEYDDYEILIFPDHMSDEEFSHTRIIPSGEVGPADKRDMALQYAKGEIFAFIDDDAYPGKDWLKNAVAYFEDPEIGAVGGPAVTAPDDDIWQQASGKIYESFLCSGGYTYRYLPKEEREVDDLPSVNLIVRRNIFEQIGGYDSNYYPGEDTKLCLDIVESGKKIIYSPDVLVYHHRRKVFKQHLKQATNYAKHRGYFAKALPKTSCKLAYFIPSLFVLGLFGGPILSYFMPTLWYFYFAVIVLYLVLLIVSIRKTDSFQLWILTFVGIVATHIGYGLMFIRGLCSKELLR
jgi:cellulose synthase/poly-beta-1,6-N-acetylglucosamine synthase-like glycosyltransferase